MHNHAYLIADLPCNRIIDESSYYGIIWEICGVHQDTEETSALYLVPSSRGSPPQSSDIVTFRNIKIHALAVSLAQTVANAKTGS